MATIAKLDVLLGLKSDNFTKGIEKSRKKIDDLGKSIRSAGVSATKFATLPIAAGFTAAVFGASNLEESLNKVSVRFGEAGDMVVKWGDANAHSLGLTKSAALDMNSSFGGMLKSVAENDQELANMSTTLTQLVGDFASFENLSLEESFIVISSALAGETEAIRRYGVDVSAARVEMKALELGLADTTAELTEQDKALARYHLIMEQTTDQQGDAARTANSFANVMRRVRARALDLAASFGRHLLPFATRIGLELEKLIGWFEDLSPTMQKVIIVTLALVAAIGPLLVGIGLLLPLLSAGLGVFAALLSPIGLVAVALAALAFVFRDELGAALGWFGDRLHEVVVAFQAFNQITDPVTAALKALSIVFPELSGFIAPLITFVDQLKAAFDAFQAGDYDVALSRLIAAFRNLGAAILDGVASIDWGAIVSRLGDLAGALAGWIFDQAASVDWGGVIADAAGAVWDGVVALGNVTIRIAGWIIEQIGNLWGQLKAQVFAWLGGDSSQVGQVIGAVNAATGTTPNIPIGTVTLVIAAWAFDVFEDAGEALKTFLGTIITNVERVILQILGFDPIINADIDKAIRDAIGDIVVSISDWSVSLTDPDFVQSAVQIGALVAAGLIALAIVVPAVTVAAPFIITAGAITAGLLLAFALAAWAIRWAEENPIEAVKVVINFVTALGNIENGILAAAGVDSWKEFALSLIGLPKDGIIRVKVRAILDWGFSAGDAESLESIVSDPTAQTRSTFDFQSQLDQLNEMAAAVDRVSTSAAGLVPTATDASDAVTRLIDATSVGPVFVGPFAQGMSAVASAGRLMSAALNETAASVTSTFGQMAGNAATRLASMTATATANFTSIRSTATSNTSQMAASIGSTVSTMASTSAATILGMKVGISANMLAMRTSGVSNAQSMASGVGAAMAGMSVGVRLSVSSAFNAIPGIIAGAGASAVSTAIFVGRSIANGVAAGMRSALGSVIAASNEIIAAANRAMIAKALISSPSRLFMHHGEMIAAGLAMGIDAGRRDVMRATGELVGLPGGLAGVGAGGGTTHYNPQVIFQPGSIVQQPGEDSAALAQRIGDVTLARLKTAFVDVEGVA